MSKLSEKRIKQPVGTRDSVPSPIPNPLPQGQRDSSPVPQPVPKPSPGDQRIRLPTQIKPRQRIDLTIKPPQIKPRVKLIMPKGTLFVGSYHRIPVLITPKNSLNFDDIIFEVPAGNMGGLISPSRDKSFNPNRPHIMLLVGYKPGDYEIQALNSQTKTILGRGKFRVDAIWRNEDNGPSKWFTGIATENEAAAAWGGGSAGPQNVNILPTTGTRRIAIVLIDTNSQRYTTNATDLQNIRTEWLDAIFNGVTDAGGITRSSRLYYQEVSYNNFDLSAQVFGPVNLPGSWDDYFNIKDAPKNWQTFITASDGLINFSQFDTILFVSRPVDGPPRKGAWPCASMGNWGPYTTAEGNFNLGVISMPSDWDLVDPRTIWETFSHELAHNLRLPNLYEPIVSGRNLREWDLMDKENPLPHLSMAFRMMLGWIPAGWIEPFNFQSMPPPVDQTVQLHPVELGAPTAGRKSGIEVRLADGWNYYFEYRKEQAAQIGDRNLPTDNRVLGIDSVSLPWIPPITRPSLLLLNNDVDGDGPVLGNGQDYKETDRSDPFYPTDFEAEVSGIDGYKADVRIKYGISSRPDPSIRPWPAGPDRQWQSPDIEIVNARNQADVSWKNVPWVGNNNKIVAKILNSGTLDAPAVTVNFSVLNYTVGGGPETYLGTDQKDVSAGATIPFEGNWVPPSEGHYCIRVRILLYQHPTNPSVIEMTELNNMAQTNYDRFISTTSSSPTRETTFVEVGNPYPRRTKIWLTAGQTNPLYRTYLEHSWIYLNPGETRKVIIMLEYAPDNMTNSTYYKSELEQYQQCQIQPNEVTFRSFIEDPRAGRHYVVQNLGGAQIQVVTGRATKFDRFTIDESSVFGTIVTVDQNNPVNGGKVIIRVSTDGEESTYYYHTVAVSNGIFSAKLPKDGNEVKCYYIPSAGFGECETETMKRS